MGVVLLHRCCGFIATVAVAAIAFASTVAASAVIVTAATTTTPTLLPEHQDQNSTFYTKTRTQPNKQTARQIHSYYIEAMSLTADNLINISLGSLSAILALLPCICACIQLYRELLQRRPQRQQRHKKWHGATRASSFSSQISLSISLSSSNISTDALLDDLEAQNVQSHSAVGSFDFGLEACGLPAVPRAAVYVARSTHGQPLTGELSGQRR